MKKYGVNIKKVKTNMGDLFLLDPTETPLYKMIKGMGSVCVSACSYEWIEDDLRSAKVYDKDNLDSILGLK